MFVMAHHPDSTAVSFQETHALAPLLKESGKPSSVNSSIYTRFPVATALLAQSLTLACANHEAFTTRFSVDANAMFQRERVSPAQAFLLLEDDLGNSLEDPLVNERILLFFKNSFNFDDEHWLRVLLIRTRDGASLLVFRTPHVIYDSASVRLFITETWGYYEALTKDAIVTPVATRFSLRDYAASQQVWAESADFERQFNGLLAHTRKGLDTLAARAAVVHEPLVSRPGVFRLTRLLPDLQAQVTALATQLKTSPSVLLMAISVVFFSRISGRRDFCFRMPFSGRITNGTESIIGFLSNDLPMFVNIDENQTFPQLVRKVQQESMSVMRYGGVPWHMLTRSLKASHPVTPFDDYLVNIIPAVEHFGQAEAMHARSFSLPITGKTNSILKVLMYVIDSGTSVTLKVGEEKADRLEPFLLPEFLRLSRLLVQQLDQPLHAILNSPPLAHEF